MNIERESSYKTFLKSKLLWSVVGVIILLLIVLFASYNAGHSKGLADQKVKLEHKMVTYKQLVKSINGQKSELTLTGGELQDTQNQLDGVTKDLSDNKEKFDKLQALSDNKDKLENTIDGDKAELKSLESDISDAKDNLSTLTGQVQEAEGAPKTLEAGTFTVGEDIPAGRYKATPVGEGSNFFVYDIDGSTMVNTILGVPEAGGVPSYTFEAEDGDTIETEAAAKLTPVK